MGIEIQMTGSGELGPIAPGWSVQEYATPVTIGETAGGTGSVTFNAAARDDSLFVVNNNITTTEETMGSISGVVKSVSQSGLNVSITHNTALSIFDATKDIPALGAGGIYAALDLCNQLSGRQNLLTLPSGHFYTMGGHSAGFDSDGFLVEPVKTNGSYQKYNPSTGQFYTEYFREQYGSIWASSFAMVGGKIWANKVYGDCFSNNPGTPVSRMAFKTMLNGGNTSWGFSALPDDSNTSTGQVLNLAFNYAANTLNLTGEYRYGGLLQKIDQSLDLGTQIDKTKEIAVFIEYTRPTTLISPYVLTITVCNTEDYGARAVITQSMSTAYPYYNSPWTITGNVRSIYRNQGKNLGDWIGEYEIEETYNVNGAVSIGQPVPAMLNTNMWEYLQAACSAFGYELSIVNDIISVRSIGTNVLDISNSTTPTISPNMTLNGRSIEVKYTNAVNIVEQEIYNAYNDNNRVISVKADESITTTLEISGTPIIVNLPSPSASARAGVGEYSIASSNGTPVPQKLWADAGGKLEVDVNPDNPNAIDVKLIGPSSSWVYNGGTPFGGSSPQYAGPFKLAYSSGNTDYAALSVVGTGVRTNTRTLKIYTAADPEKVAQDVAKTISNIFIATKNQAYDRGIWAVYQASGPNVLLTGSVPVSNASAFGLVAGSLIRYRDSIYRVTDATIGNLVINFSASRHVTVNDFDSVWAGSTVAKHDLLWNGYDTSDQVIRPLWFVGDDESVVMFLDTDVNPYYDLDGEPEISVFQDDDTNPYYADGGNLDGEDPVFLDTDDNPYDGNL